MSTKRKQSTYGSADVNESHSAKRPHIRDLYCWLCHQNDTNIQCKTCIRSYHSRCIGPKTINRAKEISLNYQCDACIKTESANSYANVKFNEIVYLNRLLNFAIGRMLKDDEIKRFDDHYFDAYNTEKTDDAIVNCINLCVIRDNVIQWKYASTVEFWNDIRWIRHNVIIVSENIASASNQDDLRVTKRMESLCSKEMYDIEMCQECYQNSNMLDEWFTEVCDPPHLLVWARIKGDKYYAPAKVLGLTNAGSKRIDVRFFGTHDMSTVKQSDCFIYSRHNPNRRSDEKNQLKLLISLAEVNAYIENIQLKYRCGVNTSDCGLRQFNSQKIGEHLLAMIPSLDLPPNFKLTVKPNYLCQTVCRNKAARSNTNCNNSPRSINSSSTSSSSVSLLSMSPADSRFLDEIEGQNLEVNYNAHILLFRCDDMLTAEQFQFIQNSANGIETFENQNAEIHENDGDLNQTNNTNNLIDTTFCTESLDVHNEGSINEYTDDSQMVESLTSTHEGPGFSMDDSHIEENVVQSNVKPSDQDVDGNSTDKSVSEHLNCSSNSSVISKDEISNNEINMAVIGNEFNPESNGTATDQNEDDCHQNMSDFLEPIAEIEKGNQSGASDSTESRSILNQTDANESTKAAELSDEIDILIETIRQSIIEKELIFQARENEQAKAYADLEQRSASEIIRLKLENSASMEKCAVMQQNLDTLKSKHSDQIQRAVEETKKKRWCWKCLVELPMKIAFHIPMCKKCLVANWNDDEQVEPSSDFVHPDGNENSSTMQGLVADLMDDTDVNVPVQTDCEARVDPADPLCADLEGY